MRWSDSSMQDRKTDNRGPGETKALLVQHICFHLSLLKVHIAYLNIFINEPEYVCCYFPM